MGNVTNLGKNENGKWVPMGATTNANGDPAGSMVVDGLAPVVRVEAGTTYNATVILGFRVLVIGSGDLTFTTTNTAATPITIANAEVSIGDYPIPCTTVTTGAGQVLLAYIPAA